MVDACGDGDALTFESDDVRKSIGVREMDGGVDVK